MYRLPLKLSSTVIMAVFRGDFGGKTCELKVCNSKLGLGLYDNRLSQYECGMYIDN